MNKSWNQCFKENVIRFGNRIAVIEEDRTYTYKELDALITSFALVLRKSGIKKGLKVSIMLDNSVEAVIAIQSVIRAGAIYVPINVKDAMERKKQIVTDSECSLLITDITHDAEELTMCEKLVYEELISGLRKEPYSEADEIEDDNDESDTAYLLYTSGTTGKPKGAMLSHGNLIAQMEGLRKEFQLNEKDVWSQFHTICFDFSVLEIFGALYNGAALAIVPEAAKLDGRKLLNFIEKKEITVLGLVPSIMYRVPVEEAGKLKVRLMILGGEKLGFKSLKAWFEKVPDCIAVNGYGLTETTIFNTGKRIDRNSNLEDVGNIGHAFAPNIMLLANESSGKFKLVKQEGQEGEILLGGATVSAGYWKREELNQEKYINLPEYKGVRFFRTGDYGRLSANGDIYFTGRRDNQIKLRGFRIELEEIEGKLRKIPSIKDVAVKVDKERELILAFVVSEGKSVEEIYTQAEKSLPKYMLPHRWKLLEELPVTDRGKVDKSRLVMKQREGMVKAFTPCETSIQLKIQEIWKACLEITEEIGCNDSFYELGGDSLCVISMIEKVKNIFHTAIRLVDFIENPTIDYISRRVEESQKLSEEELTESEQIKITHKYTAEYPMTDLQQAFFIGREATVALGNCASHSYAEILCPKYNKEKVEAVIKKLVKRHPMLRCYFDDLGNHHIVDDIQISLTEHDFTGVSQEERKAGLMKIRQRMETTILNTGIAPLARVEISKLPEEKALVHLYVDALISDGWSHELLLYEADQLYKNPDAVLDANDFTFGDFVEYNEKLKNTTAYQKAGKFWREHLKELPENPELLVGEVADSNKQIVSHQMRQLIDWESWKRVEENAAGEGMTSFIISLTAFCKSVARYSKNQHFVINLPVSNRPESCENIDKLVGVCSNFFLLDFENRKQESLYDTAKRVQKRLWELKENDSFNGNEIIRELYQSNGDVGGFVASIVFTSLMDIPFPPKEMLKRTYLETHTSQIWMDTVVMWDEDGVSFNCDFVEGIIEDALAENIITSCIKLVKSYGEDPVSWKHISEIPLTKEEQTGIEIHNRKERNIPEKSITDYLGDRAKETPDNIFLWSETEQISYGEFYQQVKAFSRYLMGVSKKDKNHSSCKEKDAGRIAIVTNKANYQILSIFAAIGTGGVYVPLDEGFPPEVIVDALEKTKAKIVITDNHNMNKILKVKGKLADIAVVNVESEDVRKIVTDTNLDGFELKKRSIYDPFVTIFTSGTTGKPKGILLKEAGIMNSVLFTNEKYQVKETDTAIALTNVCHDMSMYDMFGMAVAGGTLLVPEKEGARDPEHWKKLLRQKSVTVINSVPAFTEMLLLAMGKAQKQQYLGNLRLVIQGGDFLKPSHAENLKSINSRLQLVNVGGPTETSLWSIYHDVTDEEIASGKIPYGKAISNMKHYILNDNLEIAPKGVAGTIYSEGIGLAEEYVGMKALTDKKFLNIGGRRMFNTGDVGYYNSDYEIIIKGRDDNQIKINGKRIELEEIESCINSIKEVHGNSCVYVKEKNKLCAFYVADRELEKKYITNELEGKLAHYMIPSDFFWKEALSITRNGKLDRKSLEKEAVLLLSNVEENSEKENRELDEIDQKLLSLTCEILDRKDISITDNFFMEGGNSILAIKLIAAIKNEFGIKLKLGDIFSSADISSWKELIREELAKNSVEEMKVEDISYDRIPLSSAQTGIWFYQQIHKDSKYTVMAYADISNRNRKNHISIEHLGRAIDDVVNSSAIFKLQFYVSEDGVPFQKLISERKEKANLEVVDVTKDVQSQLENLGSYIFSIGSERLYRFIYLRQNPYQGKLVILMHHLLVDEATMEVIYNDIIDNYISYEAGERKESRARSDRYLKYCVEKSKEVYDKEILKKDFTLVTEKFLGKIKEETYETGIVNWRKLQINPETEHKLKEISSKSKSTLFATVYGIYMAALYLTYAEENVITTTTFSDRIKEEDAWEYGMYVYNHLISCKIHPSDSLKDVVERVTKNVQAVFDHPILPVSDAVRELSLPSEYLKLINNFVFTYVDSDRKERAYENTVFYPLNIDKKVGDMNVNLLVEKINGNFIGNLYYSNQVASDDMDRLGMNFEGLINSCDTVFETELLELVKVQEDDPAEDTEILMEELGDLF